MVNVGESLRGGGFDCYLLAEGFELADQVALAGFGVVVQDEVISAQILIGAVVGQQVPGDDQDAVTDSEYRPGLAFFPKVRSRWRYWAGK